MNEAQYLKDSGYNILYTDRHHIIVTKATKQELGALFYNKYIQPFQYFDSVKLAKNNKRWDVTFSFMGVQDMGIPASFKFEPKIPHSVEKHVACTLMFKHFAFQSYDIGLAKLRECRAEFKITDEVIGEDLPNPSSYEKQH